MCQKALGVSRGLLGYLCFAGLLGARSAGLEPATFSVRSHSPSQTGRYSGGQGETKQRFYRVLALLEGQGGTGRDTRLRSDCGQNVEPRRRVLEPEDAEGFEVVSREARPQDASGGILAPISHVPIFACGRLRARRR